jgi:hypothetical protein
VPKVNKQRIDILHATLGRKTSRSGGVDDSLVSQPWSDLGRRAIPLIGNENFVYNFGAEVDASA